MAVYRNKPGGKTTLWGMSLDGTIGEWRRVSEDHFTAESRQKMQRCKLCHPPS